MNNSTPNFIPELRLVFQGSIKIECDVLGDDIYDELKTFLKEIDPTFTINAQILKMLEPCCNKKKETPKHD